jgi:hypothetical protein
MSSPSQRIFCVIYVRHSELKASKAAFCVMRQSRVIGGQRSQREI